MYQVSEILKKNACVHVLKHRRQKEKHYFTEIQIEIINRLLDVEV